MSRKLKSDVHVIHSLEKRSKSRSDFADTEDYIDSVNSDVDCKYRPKARISAKHTDYAKVALKIAKQWGIHVDGFSLQCVEISSGKTENGYLIVNLEYNWWAFYHQTAPGYFTDGYERLCERVASYSF